MRKHRLAILLGTFLHIYANVYAADIERKVLAEGDESLRPYISMSCLNNRMRFKVQWHENIGTPGKYRRHLVLPGELGDTHLLLQVMPDRTSTGLYSDIQTKSLIRLILQNVKTDYIFLEVSPEGRDQMTGEWKDAKFNRSDFVQAVETVAAQCKWHKEKQIPVTIRTVTPGVPYDGE